MGAMSLRGSGLALLAGLVLLGCTQEASSPPTTVVITLPPTTTTTTTTTVPPTTTSTTTTSTTTPTTTTTEPGPTTTTEPAFVEALVLGPDGLGSVRFGADPNGAIDYIVSFLGSPTADTGWVASDDFALCPGDEVRRIEWGVLQLEFGDVSVFAVDRLHVYAWHYGLSGQLGEDPVGLRTPEGIGLGSTLAEVTEVYPDVQLFDGDQDLSIPPQFVLSDMFYGFSTGLGPDDVVTEMFSGYRCGE